MSEVVKSNVLQKLRDVDPNNSDAVKEVITSFFQTLPKYADHKSNVWLRGLEDVITRFPRYCSQHRPTIENYLVNFLHSSNYNNVILAAICAHALQQIRPGPDKNATPKNCWREQMSLLCSAAHTLIESIFSKTINVYKNSGNVEMKVAQLLANSPLTAALSSVLNVKKSRGAGEEDNKTILSTKLRNIFVFIQAMLVEAYPVAKPIQPQLILRLIVQAFRVSSGLNSDVAEASAVKIQALRTLDALISCLGPNFIPFSGIVFRFVMQTLRWSAEHPKDKSSEVRIAAYNTLTKWQSILVVYRHSSDGKQRSWEDELTNHVINDVTAPRKIVQLTMSNQYTKNLSKKARKKLANTMLKQSNISKHGPGENNKENVSEESSDEVANAALECGTTFLLVSGIFLKPTTHKIFQERLVRECYNMDGYSVERALSLLRMLEAARKSTPATVPPPTQYCLHLYSTLVNSQSDEIRKFCSQALLDIRLHLHCSPPSLNFALEVQQATTTAKNKKKEISKKNRDALEALLGKDKVPPENVEESYTFDEPLNKKPRLAEHATERISISSDSADSVVISDDTHESDDDVQEIVTDNIEPEGDASPKEPETVALNLKTRDDDDESIRVDAEDIPQDIQMSVDTTSEQKNDQVNTLEKETNIHEANTQVPLNLSNDTVDGDKTTAVKEIASEIPTTEKNVSVLETTNDENLPGTDDSDDVQISCGQVPVSPQDLHHSSDNVEIEIEISTAPTETNEMIIDLNDEPAETRDANETENVTKDNIEVKITSAEVTVEDMLADFVDEVNEEPTLVV